MSDPAPTKRPKGWQRPGPGNTPNVAKGLPPPRKTISFRILPEINSRLDAYLAEVDFETRGSVLNAALGMYLRMQDLQQTNPALFWQVWREIYPGANVNTSRSANTDRRSNTARSANTSEANTAPQELTPCPNPTPNS